MIATKGRFAMNIKIGAQYYTIRDYCQTIEDFDNSCKKVSEIGYKAVQLSGIGAFTADEIKPILDKYGLKVVCTHRGAQSYLENLDKEIEFHKTLDCNICGLGVMPNLSTDRENVLDFCNKFSPICEKLKEHGLVFAYHNHAFEFDKIDGQFAFDFLIDHIKSDNFKLILDVYWLSYAGVNPAKFLREHKDNIACVHFKDLKIVKNTPCFAEVGQGNIDWDDVISACDEANIEYALVEQDRCDGDPFECLKTSFDFLMEDNK